MKLVEAHELKEAAWCGPWGLLGVPLLCKCQGEGESFMQELEVTWAHVGSVAWLFFWRSFVGGAICGFFGGLLVGLVDTFILHRGPNPIAASAVGWLFALPWTIAVFRMALKKRYRTFRIALIAVDPKM